MKCPRCGTNNKPGQSICIKCGYALTEKSDLNKPSNLWSESGEKKVPLPAAEPARPRRHRHVIVPQPDNLPVVELDTDTAQDEQEFYEAVQQARNSGQAVKGKLDDYSSGQEINVVLPPEPAAAAKRKPRSRIRWGRFLLAIFILLVFGAALTYGAMRGITYLRTTLDSGDTGSSGPYETPLVERMLINDEPWHKITFYGKDGDRVLINTPYKSAIIHNGIAEFLFEDSNYIPEDLVADNDTISVKIDASIFDSKGKETKMDVPSYDVEIPLSPLKIILPAAQPYITTENNVTIKIKVEPGSKVFINGSNVTDYIDDSGYLSRTVDVEPIGENTITISVETPKERTNTYALLVDRPQMDVDLKIDTLDKSTSDSEILISGVAEVGSTVTTDAVPTEDITQSASTGEFKFTAPLKHYGWNIITVTATNSTGQTGVVTCRVERKADLAAYTQKAWPMDYAYLTNSTDALIGQVFVCYGSVEKAYEDDTGNYFMFNMTDTQGKTQIIVIDDQASTNMEVGKSYRLYADVTGTYDNYPLLTARFVYEQ